MTRRAGVVGWPVAHSRSPALHGFWLKQYGIDGTYERISVEPADFPAFLRRLPQSGLQGVNVTLPHKEAAFAAVDQTSAFARRVGAVNTIVVENDRLLGSNTDGFGFLENLKSGSPGFVPDAGPAVVLGAGGAGRAIVAALLDAGLPEIRLCNRNTQRAEALAQALGGSSVRLFTWSERAAALDDAALLVNTTSLGMAGQPPLDIALAKLPATAVVNDIVYTPLETTLLAEARQRGNPVVDGLGMLLHQARPGFAAWFGVEPEVTRAQRAAVLAC